MTDQRRNRSAWLGAIASLGILSCVSAIPPKTSPDVALDGAAPSSDAVPPVGDSSSDGTADSSLDGTGDGSPGPDAGIDHPDSGWPRMAMRAPSCGRMNELVPCPCIFAREGDPRGFSPSTELVNVPSHRLTAPAGGLWWIRQDLGMGPARGVLPEGGAIELEVVQSYSLSDIGPLTILRVPPRLVTGARLTVGAHELVVSSPLRGRVDLEAISVEREYRPELGGTGVLVRVPADHLGRLYVLTGFVAPPTFNPLNGLQVLKGLLLDDAAKLCEGSNQRPPGQVFIPMWQGQLSQAVHLSVYDADDFTSKKRFILEAP